MNRKMKNIDMEKSLILKELIEVQEGQVVSKTLAQKAGVSITLFAFDKEEEISTHHSEGDAMVTVLEGRGQVTIGEATYDVKEGQTIVMPSSIPHSVYAAEAFKMLLTVVF